jgi:hypothetical protein
VPRVRDFRRYSYRPDRLDRCGRDVGSKLYWKLYAIENTIRIVIHSVLTAQIGPTWWDVAADATIRKNVRRFRANYGPQNASPGSHDIYLVFLSDLTKILRANNHLFVPIIRDTNNWIATLEGILAPRNLVGHMNFPNVYDRLQVNNAYTQLPGLIGQLTASNVPILNPT